MRQWWRVAALVIAIVVVAFLLIRGRETDSAAPLVPCDQSSSLYLKLQDTAGVLEVQRDQLGQQWLETKPAARSADQAQVGNLLDTTRSLHVLNTIDRPATLDKYGLAAPQLALQCRVSNGASYTLSVGDPSFDGSGYYAQKAGDARVYVIAAHQVDEFVRALASPAEQPSTSPQPTP